MTFTTDKIRLLAVAVICSIFAFMFWHFLGQNAFYVFPSLVALIYLVEWIDKRRKRNS